MIIHYDNTIYGKYIWLLQIHKSRMKPNVYTIDLYKEET